jgi:hypothetical protein
MFSQKFERRKVFGEDEIGRREKKIKCIPNLFK